MGARPRLSQGLGLPQGDAPGSFPSPLRGNTGKRSGLLVSVRSGEEARAALAGGADVIDIKEPARGSLGRADEVVLREVLSLVAGRRLVSAALGELGDPHSLPPLPAGLSYVKWGLSGLSAGNRWPRALDDFRASLARTAPGTQLVAVGYADFARAGSPPPEEVCHYALDRAVGAFLLDTWGKDGSGLLDWMTIDEVHRLCRTCREGGVPVALAGSLGPREIVALRGLAPDWFAVRGAVCTAGRASAIDEGKVRCLTALLGDPGLSSSPGATVVPPLRD
jgi:uncharacterized protein (UPF0264 family)